MLIIKIFPAALLLALSTSSLASETSKQIQIAKGLLGEHRTSSCWYYTAKDFLKKDKTGRVRTERLKESWGKGKNAEVIKCKSVIASPKGEKTIYIKLTLDKNQAPGHYRYLTEEITLESFLKD
jgi:uncharacterized membrane protein